MRLLRRRTKAEPASPVVLPSLDRLATPPDDDTVTVVWQSITRQYWPADEVVAVGEAVRDAATRMPLAWVAMEYPEDGLQANVTLSGLAEDGSPSTEDVVLGQVGDHGVPMVTTGAAKLDAGR